MNETIDILFLKSIKFLEKTIETLEQALEIMKKEDIHDLYEDEIRHLEYNLIDSLQGDINYLNSEIDSIRLEKITIQTYSSKLEEFEQRIKQLEDKILESE